MKLVGARLLDQSVAFFSALTFVYATSCSAQALVYYVAGDTAEAVEQRRSKIEGYLAALKLQPSVDFTLVARTFAGEKSRLPELVDAALKMRPAILYAGSWDVAQEMKRQTKVVPIVFAARANLESPNYRIVENLSRPEGNLTGFTRYVNLVPKKLQILKEAFPSVKSVGFVYGVPIKRDRELEYSEAAKALGITLRFRWIEKTDLSSLAVKLKQADDDAFLIAHDDLLIYNRSAYLEQIPLVTKPVIFPEEATPKGVLMHYAPIFDGEAKAAEYIAKILRGAKIRDLAVQEPQEFDFSVNVTTLRKLGLTMSRDVLARARKVE